MNKGEVVWTVGMQDVANIGEGLMSGTYVCQAQGGLDRFAFSTCFAQYHGGYAHVAA